MPSNYKIKNHMGPAGKGKGEEEEEAVSGLECLKKEMIIDKEGPDEEDYSMDSDQQNCSTGCTSPSSSSSSSLNGPLFQLSDLMAQLPIKRGLSRYYEGKSQSHTSLASVKCVEDLVKKKMKMKMRWCRSHGCFSPKATISKKGSSTPYMLRF